jgi:hypothetical protein
VSTDTDQTYVLDSAGWVRNGPASYRYLGPTGGDGDPVRRVVLRADGGAGKAFLKVLLNGAPARRAWTPCRRIPAMTAASSCRSEPSAATYCASFGGAAGGVEQADDASRWRITDPTAEAGCPSP